jgi:WD40 repeat protein
MDQSLWSENIMKLIFTHFRLFEWNNLHCSNKNKLILKSLMKINRKDLTHFEDNHDFISDPKTLEFKTNLACNYSFEFNNETFAVYTTINGNKQLAYPTSVYTIEVYDLYTDTKRALSGHSRSIIISLRHFRRTADYLVSTAKDKQCKVWDLASGTNILIIRTNYSEYFIYFPALMVFDGYSDKYIVTTEEREMTYIWNIRGKLLRTIPTQSNNTLDINCWYDNRDNKILLIYISQNAIKLYDFHKASCLITFPIQCSHARARTFIMVEDGIPFLYENSISRTVSVWNMNGKDLAYKEISWPSNSDKSLYWNWLCLWSERCVISHDANKIGIFDFQAKELSTIPGHNSEFVWAIYKVEHPRYGESLITLGGDFKIKLWTHGEINTSK